MAANGPKRKLPEPAEQMHALNVKAGGGAVAEREPTATEQLEELAARSHACNGLLVPVPAEITRQSVVAWLQAIAEIGSPGHVEIAWHALNKGALKQALHNEYLQIHASAARRYYALEQRAASEREAERAAWLERTKVVRRKREIAEAEARLAQLKAS